MASIFIEKIWAELPKLSCLGFFVAIDKTRFFNFEICASLFSSQDLSPSQADTYFVSGEKLDCFMGMEIIEAIRLVWFFLFVFCFNFPKKLLKIKRESPEDRLKCLYHNKGIGEIKRTILS